MKFEPGNPGGPGRPPHKFVSEAIRELVKNGLSDQAAKVLEAVAVGKHKPKTGQLQAIDMIMDRTEGKPMQQQQIAVSIDESTAKNIAELAAKIKDFT